MIEYFKSWDDKLQMAVISAGISILVSLITWTYTILKENYSLKYKMKKEYEFEQRKKLKEEIGKNKIPLLNSLEEFNYRIYSVNANIEKEWLNISEDKWFETRQYFLNSSIYRLLEFLYWVLKTEKDTITVDSTIADKNDILYLTYIKMFKNIFCDIDILSGLGYKSGDETNHFFKNDLETYTNWILTTDGKVMRFEDFKDKLKVNYNAYRKVIEYWSNIRNDDENKNLNVIRAFHLIAISFLNKYGHEYQKTNDKKLNNLIIFYNDKLKIKNGLKNFLEKNKLDKEVNKVIEGL